MKKIFITSLLLVFSFTFVPFESVSIDAINPLAGKIIALDAGHGGTELGATYPANTGNEAQVMEKDVNLSVVYTLKTALENAGAKVVLTRKCDESIAIRRERVNIALEECKNLYGKKCDALISVHHNGSIDSTHNGTMVIYNEKQDIPLAEALLDSLVPLTGESEGLDHGGYGMTVYGHLVSALTEAYYITNTSEANLYLSGTMTAVGPNDGSCSYDVRIGDRVNQESNALYQGLTNYFSVFSEDGNGGGKPEKCSPWPKCKNR